MRQARLPKIGSLSIALASGVSTRHDRPRHAITPGREEMMKRLIRWVVILGILGGLGAVAYVPAVAYWKERTKVNFRVADVTRGKIIAVVNATGTVKPVLTVTV